MEVPVLLNFLVSFSFSFIGSIPPGTINLTVIQLGLENRARTAVKFALTASLVEYPYAWIAVKFQRLIASSPVITENLQLLTAVVMVLLGIISILPASKTSSYAIRFKKSGYRRGFIIGILNPLAIPYWIGITAYLSTLGWINVTTPVALHLYLLGVFLGAFALLVVLAYLSRKVTSGFSNHPWVKKIPGIVLIALGLYSFVLYVIAPA